MARPRAAAWDDDGGDYAALMDRSLRGSGGTRAAPPPPLRARVPVVYEAPRPQHYYSAADEVAGFLTVGALTGTWPPAKAGETAAEKQAREDVGKRYLKHSYVSRALGGGYVDPSLLFALSV